MENQSPNPAVSAQHELESVLERAQNGDTAVLGKLREILDERPELWREAGNLAATVERSWLQLFAQHDIAYQESIARYIAELRAQLQGDAPTPTERLLAERVVACWLQLQYADVLLATLTMESNRNAEFAEKRQARANRQYLQAVAALETIRRLIPRTIKSVTASPARELEEGGRAQLTVLAADDELEQRSAQTAS